MTSVAVPAPTSFHSLAPHPEPGAAHALEGGDRLAQGQREITILNQRLQALQRRLDLVERKERAQRDTLASMRAQLREAAGIQRGLQSSPVSMRDVDVGLVYLPADEVSGDVYEIVRLDDTHVAIAVADATGHGVSAGLLSTFVQLALRDPQRYGVADAIAHPNHVLQRVNEILLSANLEDGQFITAVYAVYDEQRHQVRLARAGAPYPVVLKGGRAPWSCVTRGSLLGAMDALSLEVAEIQLQPGDMLVLHTDGLDGIVSPPGPGSSAGSGADRRLIIPLDVAALRSSVFEFRSQLREPDDITVVALQRRAHGSRRCGEFPAKVPVARRAAV